jgi:hypothetical protein
VGGFVFVSLSLRWGTRILRRLGDHGFFNWISVIILTLIPFCDLPMVSLAVLNDVRRCPSTHNIIIGSYRTQRRRS